MSRLCSSLALSKFTNRVQKTNSFVKEMWDNPFFVCLSPITYLNRYVLATMDQDCLPSCCYPFSMAIVSVRHLPRGGSRVLYSYRICSPPNAGDTAQNTPVLPNRRGRKQRSVQKLSSRKGPPAETDVSQGFLLKYLCLDICHSFLIFTCGFTGIKT